MPNVKGSTLQPRIKYAKDHDTGGKWQALMDGLSPETRALIEKGIMINQWYPLTAYAELSRVIDRIYGAGDRKLIWTLGRYSADEALHGIYKMFYKVSSPDWVIKMAATVWKQYYDTGRVSIELEPVPKGRSLVMTVTDFDTPSPELWLSIGGWLHRTIELSGGKNVRVEMLGAGPASGPRAQYRVAWD